MTCNVVVLPAVIVKSCGTPVHMPQQLLRVRVYVPGESSVLTVLKAEHWLDCHETGKDSSRPADDFSMTFTEAIAPTAGPVVAFA